MTTQQFVQNLSQATIDKFMVFMACVCSQSKENRIRVVFKMW